MTTHNSLFPNPINMQGLLGSMYVDPRMASYGGAARAIAPFTGFTKYPTSLGQVIGAAGAGGYGGLLGANRQNLTSYGQGLGIQGSLQKMATAKAATVRAQAERDFYAKIGVDKYALGGGAPTSYVKSLMSAKTATDLAVIKAGEHPFGPGTEGMMWKYYTQGPKGKYYNEAVSYLSNPRYIQTPMGTIKQPAALNRDGTLVATTPQPRRPAATQPDQSATPIVPGTSITDVAAAKQSVLDKATYRKNAISYQTYSIGMNQLTEALSKVDTGPAYGLLPALTSAQKTAEGARAAMAPVLKTLFRESGEGTFTKDDQEILMAMLPDRGDDPDTIKNKVAMVNALVMSKLGIGSDGGAMSAAAEAILEKLGIKAEGQ